MTQVQLRDITPAFGAEVLGFDPRSRLEPDTARTLRSAFDERGLLLFRDLEIDPDVHRELAGLMVAPATAIEEGTVAAITSEPYFVSNREDDGGAPFGQLLYHSDMMWADEPFQVLTLYGLVVEPPSVPTVFTSAAAAWDSLPDDLRAAVDGRSAVHVTGQQARGDTADGELLQAQWDTARMVTKPIAHRHPRTGRTLLYVSQMMTRNVVDLDEDESEALLEALFAHLYRPEVVWQHDWREGDLVMWDNLAIQHARSGVQLEGPTRTLRKVIAPVVAVPGRGTTAPTFSSARGSAG